jgi:hypothetical protein
MQPNEFIIGFVLLGAAFCGWKLIRFVRSRSNVSKVAGRVSGAGILVISGCLLLLYGCGMAKKYRSAPSFSPDRKHMAQVTELDFGPGPFNTEVELRSRWQVFPEIVFDSHYDPTEIEAKWPSNSELVIRYASGYASDHDYPLLCMRQFKTVKITCEPVEGYTLHRK